VNGEKTLAGALFVASGAPGFASGYPDLRYTAEPRSDKSPYDLLARRASRRDRLHAIRREARRGLSRCFTLAKPHGLYRGRMIAPQTPAHIARAGFDAMTRAKSAKDIGHARLIAHHAATKNIATSSARLIALTWAPLCGRHQLNNCGRQSTMGSAVGRMPRARPIERTMPDLMIETSSPRKFPPECRPKTS